MNSPKLSRSLARSPVAAFLLMALHQSLWAQQQLTLEQALELAERNHPQLNAERALLDPAEAELREARSTLWHNPELNVEARRRALAQAGGAPVRRSDAAVGVTQTFEIAGQPGARRGVAKATVEASRYAIEQTRQEVRLETAKHFIETLQLKQRLEAEQSAADLLRQAAQAVSKRVKAGEDTRLDGNLANVEAERAVAQSAQTADELAQAQAGLATALQLPPSSMPDPVGPLLGSTGSYTLDDLLATAARHPKIQAAEARERAASSRLELERASRYPDVTLGLSHSPERGIDGTDRITTVSVSVPLPLFRDNGAAIARADAELTQSRIELQAVRRDTEAAVRVLWRRLEQLRQRAQRLESTVLPALQDNQRLSLAALHAGEINVSQFLLARRQAVEAQREVADAQAQVVLAQLELEAAAARDWAPRGGPETQKETR